MIHYGKLLFLISLCLSAVDFSNSENLGLLPYNVSYNSVDNVIGYKYNLWAIKATSLCDDQTYSFTGRIFLDKRKTYKSTFDKGEHTFMYKFEFKNGETHFFGGNQDFSEVIKYDDIKNYYIALKFDRDWIHHTYDDIIKVQNFSAGKEVGCNSCNFSKVIYSKENTWMFTLFYEIKPIYKNKKNGTPALVPTKNQAVDNGSVVEPMVAKKVSDEINNNGLHNLQMINSKSISYHVLFTVLDNPNEQFKELKNMGPVYEDTLDDNSATRYFIGNETNYKQVIEIAKQMHALGFKECKIAKYKNGQVKSYLKIN